MVIQRFTGRSSFVSSCLSAWNVVRCIWCNGFTVSEFGLAFGHTGVKWWDFLLLILYIFRLCYISILSTSFLFGPFCVSDIGHIGHGECATDVDNELGE
ncbi:hypothetical protein V8F20_008474 [Naviculisporaceae sp. PSN 640]